MAFPFFTPNTQSDQSWENISSPSDGGMLNHSGISRNFSGLDMKSASSLEQASDHAGIVAESYDGNLGHSTYGMDGNYASFPRVDQGTTFSQVENAHFHLQDGLQHGPSQQPAEPHCPSHQNVESLPASNFQPSASDHLSDLRNLAKSFELGLLSKMRSQPECDYALLEQLYRKLPKPNDTKKTAWVTVTGFSIEEVEYYLLVKNDILKMLAAIDLAQAAIYSVNLWNVSNMQKSEQSYQQPRQPLEPVHIQPPIMHQLTQLAHPPGLLSMTPPANGVRRARTPPTGLRLPSGKRQRTQQQSDAGQSSTPEFLSTVEKKFPCSMPRCKSKDGVFPSRDHVMNHTRRTCMPKNLFLCPVADCPRSYVSANSYTDETNLRSHLSSRHGGDWATITIFPTAFTRFHSHCPIKIGGEQCSMTFISRQECISHLDDHYKALEKGDVNQEDFEIDDICPDSCHPPFVSEMRSGFSNSRDYGDGGSGSGPSGSSGSAGDHGEGPSGRRLPDNGPRHDSSSGSNERYSVGGNDSCGYTYETRHSGPCLKDWPLATLPNQTYYPCIPRQVDSELLMSHGELGEGGYGLVDEVLHLKSFKVYARKTIRFDRSENQSSTHFQNELRALARLKHLHIIRLEGYYTNRDYSAILMSPVADSNLAAFFRSTNSVADLQAKTKLLWSWKGCLTSALAHLHNDDIRVLHRDLKPENILVKGNQILLADFGSSSATIRPKTPTAQTKLCNAYWRENLGIRFKPQFSHDHFAVTAKYCAPEVIKTKKSGRKADVWSMGCILLEMLTYVCGATIQDFEMYRSSSNGSTCFSDTLDQTLKWAWQLRTPKEYSLPSYITRRNLILSMLNKDPLERPNAQFVADSLPHDSCPALSTENVLFPKPNHTDSAILNINSEDAESKKSHCLHKLAITTSPESANIDIVFVHGLHGTLERLSWITSAVPKGRILSYNFEDLSISQARRKQGLLDLHGVNILAGLTTLRDDHKTRPLVLIGHIVGALIVTELLIKSRTKDTTTSCLSKVMGVAFLSCRSTHKLGTLTAKSIRRLTDKLQKSYGTAVGDIQHLSLRKALITSEARECHTQDVRPMHTDTANSAFSNKSLLVSGHVPNFYATTPGSKSQYRSYTKQELTSIWTLIMQKFVDQVHQDARGRSGLSTRPGLPGRGARFGGGGDEDGGGFGGLGNCGMQQIRVVTCT